MIKADKLRKEFPTDNGKLVAVKDISFQVKEGEIYGLLGANGAGKSTALMMLITLLRPTSGSAEVAGFDITREGEGVRRSIGSALQETGLDPLQTGAEILALHSRLLGYSKTKSKQRSDELLEVVGLKDARERKIATYSGGMRRRLDLAIAIISKPPLLFLDEPTTGLDPASRRDIWNEVRDLQNSGVTVLLTTQYLEEADELAGRVAIMKAGEIVKEGSPKDLKAKLGEEVIELLFKDTTAAQRAEVVIGGDLRDSVLRFPTSNGAHDIAELVSKLERNGAPEPAGVELHGPTLDDVFLAVSEGDEA